MGCVVQWYGNSVYEIDTDKGTEKQQQKLHTLTGSVVRTDKGTAKTTTKTSHFPRFSSMDR